MIDESDDLHELLAPKPGPLPDATVLLAATTKQLQSGARWRIWRNRFGGLVLFGLGLALGWFAKPVPSPEVIKVSAVEPSLPVVLPVPPTVPVVPALTDDTPLSPGQLELLAEQADLPAEMARLYRLAGNSYLNEARNYDEALRCYRLYFRHAGPEAAVVSTDDSWLLVSLKQSRPFPEKRNANPGT